MLVEVDIFVVVVRLDDCDAAGNGRDELCQQSRPRPADRHDDERWPGYREHCQDRRDVHARTASAEEEKATTSRQFVSISLNTRASMSAAVLAAWAESAQVEEHVVEYLAGVIDDGVDQIRDSATLQVCVCSNITSCTNRHPRISWASSLSHTVCRPMMSRHTTTARPFSASL